MTKMMAYIAEKTDFKENPIEHQLINSFTGKVFFMRSFDLRYADLLNDDGKIKMISIILLRFFVV